jgi:hypothetical protein
MACKLTHGPTPQDPTHELTQHLSLNIPAAHVKSLTGWWGIAIARKLARGLSSRDPHTSTLSLYPTAVTQYPYRSCQATRRREEDGYSS